MSSSRSRMLFRALLAVIGLGVCSVALLFLLRLSFWRARGGAQPAITISPETTRLTEPLLPNGYVDYLSAINAELSQGVTPENNAAVELLYATGPSSIPGSIDIEYFRRLGVDRPSSQGDYLRPLEQFEQSLTDTTNAGALPRPGQAGLHKAPFAERELESAVQRPWTSGEFPRVSACLTANAGPLKRVEAASAKSRWYTPMVSDNGRLFNVMLPQTQDARNVAKVLTARAMLRLGEGDAEAAWQDLLGCHRLARLASSGATMIEKTIAIAMDDAACLGDQAVAQYGKLAPGRLVAMQGELAKLPPIQPMVNSVDRFDRHAFLSTCADLARQGTSALSPTGRSSDDAVEQTIEALMGYATDWDIPLRMGNSYFDEMVEIAKTPDAATRSFLFASLYDQLEAMSQEKPETPKFSDPLQVREHMGTQMGRMLVSRLLPDVRTAVEGELRNAAMLAATRLSFLLAAYRAKHGRYPTELADLVPEFVDALPSVPGLDGGYAYESLESGFRLLHYASMESGEQEHSEAKNSKDVVEVYVPPADAED